MFGHLRVTLILNTTNRRNELLRLLAALERQSYEDFEIVVVVGPSEDGSAEAVARRWGDRVKLVACPEFNLSVSRNLGLAHAAGEIVAFVDDDALPSTTWLEQIAEAFRDDELSGTGGRTYLVRPDEQRLQFLHGVFSVVAEQQDVRWGHPPLPSSRTPPWFWFPRAHGTNMAYRRAALLAIGGFDERFEYLYDDGDIGVRLGLAGFKIRTLDEAVVYHVGAQSGNRGRHRYDLNWYSWSRSQIYFALKNGRFTVGRKLSLLAALRHAHHLRSRVAELYSRGELPKPLHRKARAQLRRALVNGFREGWFEPRRIPGRIPPPREPFLPFPRPLWRSLPAVAPSRLSSGMREDRPMRAPALRVALLSVDFPPLSTHGVARSTESLARGLAELGQEVHVVTAGTGHGVDSRDGYFVHSVGPVALRRYRAFAELGYPDLAAWLDHSHEAHATVLRLVANHGVELVDTPLWNLDGLVTAIAGTLPVAVRPVTAMRQIAREHGTEDAQARLLGDLEEELLRRASLVVSNSTATAEALRTHYGLDLSRIRHGIVSYGMVPRPDWEVPEPSRREREPTILFVGRLEGRKGVLDLFESVSLCLAERPDLRFVLAGADNSSHDGFRNRTGLTYPEYFQKEYRSCRDRVEFLGHVPDPELRRLYAACDLFVAPSHYESFGLILLEAMDCAKPVVACDVGGPRDIVVPGATGLLVPPRNPEALAEAILGLAGSSERRAELGRAGRQRLLQRFTHQTMAAGFLSLYRQALGRAEAELAPVPVASPA